MALLRNFGMREENAATILSRGSPLPVSVRAPISASMTLKKARIAISWMKSSRARSLTRANCASALSKIDGVVDASLRFDIRRIRIAPYSEGGRLASTDRRLKFSRPPIGRENRSGDNRSWPITFRFVWIAAGEDRACPHPDSAWESSRRDSEPLGWGCGDWRAATLQAIRQARGVRELHGPAIQFIRFAPSSRSPRATISRAPSSSGRWSASASSTGAFSQISRSSGLSRIAGIARG